MNKKEREKEDRLIEEVSEGLKGREVLILKTTLSEAPREYTVSRVTQGFSVGFRGAEARQHVTLYYKEDGKEFDFVEMYPETAKQLLDKGEVVLSGIWRLILK